MIYKAKVGAFEFNLNTEDLARLDSVPNEANTMHVLHKNKSYEAAVTALGNKTYRIVINGNKYEVKLSDAYDQLVEKMGLSVVNANVVKEIKAPMPGLVLSMVAEVGQRVEQGMTLLILEAMKMENVLKSPGEGTIKTIHVAKGQAVEKGMILIEFE
ncbi:MAG: biotin/lipoyl-containing protein [Bacteroidota bacterium]